MSKRIIIVQRPSFTGYNLRPIKHRRVSPPIEKTPTPFFDLLFFDIRYKLGEIILDETDYVSVLAFGLTSKRLYHELQKFLILIREASSSFPIYASIGRYHNVKFLNSFKLGLTQLRIIMINALSSDNDNILANTVMNRCCSDHGMVVINNGGISYRFIMHYTDIGWNIGKSHSIDILHKWLPLIPPCYRKWTLEAIIKKDDICLFKALTRFQADDINIWTTLRCMFDKILVTYKDIYQLFTMVHNYGASRILRYLIDKDNFYEEYNTVFNNFICVIMNSYEKTYILLEAISSTVERNIERLWRSH
jgi:hypothetical protein